MDGQKSEIGTSTPFTAEADKWYDVRVELQGRDIKCYVDDKLVAEATDKPAAPAPALFAAASRVDETGEVILKVVNSVDAAQQVEINLRGVTEVAKEASAELLTGRPTDMNTVEEPTKVAPKDAPITDAAATFVHEFPAYSVSVIRFKAK